MRPSGLFLRVCSYVVDMCVIAATIAAFLACSFLITAVLYLPGAYLFVERTGPTSLGVVMVALAVLIFCLAIVVALFIPWVYYCWFEVRKSATPGQKMCGLRVLAVNGLLSTSKAVCHMLLWLILVGVFPFRWFSLLALVVFGMRFFTEHNQTLYDWLCGVCFVRESRQKL